MEIIQSAFEGQTEHVLKGFVDTFMRAIAAQDNWYMTPYARTADGKGTLGIKVMDTRNAAVDAATEALRYAFYLLDQVKAGTPPDVLMKQCVILAQELQDKKSTVYGTYKKPSSTK